MIKVSDYIFKFIESKGIKHAFMLPGGGAMHLVDSLGKSNIEYICCQHEQAVAIAAEAYGQHTNNIGVGLVTSGPGATNAITGVTAGWIDSTPMFMISGQAKRSDLVGKTGVRQIGSQEVQIVEMVNPITKYAVQILEPKQIKYHLEKAYYEATTNRPGPVWLDIPLDVQGSMIEEKDLVSFISENQKPETIDNKVEDIIKLLKEAKKPLILIGNGVKLAKAEAEMDALLKQLGIPVMTTWKTIDMFGETDSLYVGHPGIMGDRGANLILQECDLFLSIGSRLDTSLTAFNEPNFAKSAKKVVVDIDPYEIKRMGIDKEIEIVCDAKLFLQTMLDKMNETFDFGTWRDYAKNIRVKFPVVTEEHKNKIDFVSAYYFIGKLSESLDENCVIVPESSGGAGEITYQAFQIKKGQKMKNAAGLGSMGFGLPYAIGSCLANEKKSTILINGDGAFQLNIQELETLQRLQLPIKIFIWNNNGYASIRAMQEGNFEGHYVASSEESGLTMPNVVKIAKAYGIKTYTINNNQEMENKLEEILAYHKPVLCELMVSPSEVVSPRVKAFRKEDGSMQSMPLEDMWPSI